MSVKYDKIMKYGLEYNVYILRHNDKTRTVNNSHNIWF